MATSNGKLGTVYAKEGLSHGVVTILHWHAPYQYWQWPAEKHQKAEASHALFDVRHPIWVHPRTTNPQNGRKVETVKPTPEQVRRYLAALDGAFDKRAVDAKAAKAKASKQARLDAAAALEAERTAKAERQRAKRAERKAIAASVPTELVAASV